MVRLLHDSVRIPSWRSAEKGYTNEKRTNSATYTRYIIQISQGSNRRKKGEEKKMQEEDWRNLTAHGSRLTLHASHTHTPIPTHTPYTPYTDLPHTGRPHTDRPHTHDHKTSHFSQRQSSSPHFQSQQQSHDQISKRSQLDHHHHAGALPRHHLKQFAGPLLSFTNCNAD